jgi:hypothetical protein
MQAASHERCVLVTAIGGTDMKTLTRQISNRVRLSMERSRERRDHDRAMTDPRIRDEHYYARARDVSAGGHDCEFCV